MAKRFGIINSDGHFDDTDIDGEPLKTEEAAAAYAKHLVGVDKEDENLEIEVVQVLGVAGRKTSPVTYRKS